MPGRAFRGEGQPPRSGQAGGRGSWAGRKVGPRPARGRAAPRFPAPGPPLRGAILQAAVAGTRGRSAAAGTAALKAAREPSELQPGESRAAAPRAGPTGSRWPGWAVRCPPRPRGRPGTAPARCHPPRGAACGPLSRPVAAGPVDVWGSPVLARPPGAHPCPLREPQRARALRPRRGEPSGVPSGPAGRRRLFPGPRPARPGVTALALSAGVTQGTPTTPEIQDHQRGGVWGEPLFPFLLSSLLQRQRQVILEAAAPTPTPVSLWPVPLGSRIRSPCCHRAGKRN